MINLSMAEPDNMIRPRITVVGVGGGGGNAINNMIRSNLDGCDFVVANTDAQALAQSLAARKIQLGSTLSRGLGAGSKPDIGCAAAEESLPDILSILEGSDMLFVTAGMGGGTGTGAAPVIARAARENGILTVGVVTKPFHFEGTHRMRQAESGIAELQKYVDTLIVIPNQNLFRIANERTTFAEAFRMADEVLHSGVRGITDLMVMPGFMNLDFADVKTVMGEMGKAMMGTGESDGDNRAIRAAEAAISNPLLDDISMKGARGVLINITGGLDMTLFEVDQAANRIREEVDPEAQIKVGSTLGENMDGKIRVSVIATGIDVEMHNNKQQTSGQGKPQNIKTEASTTSTPAQPKPAVRVVQQEPAKTAQSTTQPQVSSMTLSSPMQSSVTTTDEIRRTVSMEPATNATVSTAFFTMPSAVTPRTLAPVSVKSPVTFTKTTSESETMPVAKVVEKQETTSTITASEPSQTRTVPQQTAMQDRGEKMTTTGMGSYSEKPAMPPVREIMPVQQAQRQKTASAGAEKGDSPDMRITQLTPQSSQVPHGAMPINQRAQSLFQRITGFGLIRPSAAAKELEDELGTDEVEATPAVHAEPIDKTDKPSLSAGDSDLLDIPAFLRRQTNH